MRVKSADVKDPISAYVCLVMHLAKVRAGKKEIEQIFPETGESILPQV